MKRLITNERGVTLIEVVIGMVIGMVVVAAGFTALTSSDKATKVSDQTAQTQQSVRLAMDLLANDIRVAGFGMTGPVGACNTAIVPADNTVTGADRGPDSISLVVPLTNTIAPAWTLAGPGATTGPFSSIQLQAGAITGSTGMVQAGLVVGDTVSIGGSISGTIGNPINAAGPLFFKDATGNSITIGAPVTFPSNTPVYLLQCITYQVSNSSLACGGSAPCLLRGVAPAGLPPVLTAVADGVEDLQFAYACDGCNTAVNTGVADRIIDDQVGGVPGAFDQADFISNTTWTATPLTPDTIRMVRVTIVARQAQGDRGFGEGNGTASNLAAPLVVEDHDPTMGVFAPGDYTPATYPLTLRRRILTRTVERRNLGL